MTFDKEVHTHACMVSCVHLKPRLYTMYDTTLGTIGHMHFFWYVAGRECHLVVHKCLCKVSRALLQFKQSVCVQYWPFSQDLVRMWCVLQALAPLSKKLHGPGVA